MVSFNICEGYPGALTFLTLAYAPTKSMPELMKSERAFQRMQDNHITGAKLYMLWNDCCNRDTEYTIEIMLRNSIEDIIKHINYEGGRGIPYAVGKENVHCG